MKKILIVDDSLFMRKILKDILSEKMKFPGGNDAYSIIEADSGAKAIEQFQKEKPDLVFLDIVMPGSEEEGIDVLKKVMKIDPNAKVVMITAVGQDAIVKECRMLGVKDYIIKPFDDELVVQTVNKYL